LNKLSVVMITLNAERTLERSLASVKSLAGEIVIVDSGSSDRTLEIAAGHGARVISHPWQGYGAQKNLAIEQAACEWVLSLDADEVVSGSLARSIESLAGEPPCQGYRLPRLNHYFGRPLHHGGQYPDYQLRLFRKSRGQFDTRPVHESLKIDGRVGRLDGDLIHYTYETIEEYLQKFLAYTELEAVRLLQSGERPSTMRAIRKMLCAPVLKFIRRYLFKLGFLDGVPGLIAAAFGSFTMSVSYARFWEKYRAGSTGQK
jgi:glycosyltransferase involved in cell wall biosynthesis